MSLSVIKKRRKKTLPKSITFDEFKILMKHTPLQDKEAKVSFLLAYGSGLRLSEVTNLQKSNIKKDSIEILLGKGSKDRTVPKPKGWKEWMTAILPISKSGRSLERNFKTSIRKANLPENYTFHSLRHGFATRLIEQGSPLSYVQLLLGHSNLATTSVYTKARPLDALKSYEELF